MSICTWRILLTVTGSWRYTISVWPHPVTCAIILTAFYRKCDKCALMCHLTSDKITPYPLILQRCPFTIFPVFFTPMVLTFLHHVLENQRTSSQNWSFMTTYMCSFDICVHQWNYDVSDQIQSPQTWSLMFQHMVSNMFLVIW